MNMPFGTSFPRFLSSSAHHYELIVRYNPLEDAENSNFAIKHRGRYNDRGNCIQAGLTILCH